MRLRIAQSLWVLVSLGGPCTAHASTSVGVAVEDVRRTIYVAHNFADQTQADQAAIEGCRTSARSNGAGTLAGLCKVVERQTNAGAGALVCGDAGCASAYGNTEAIALKGALQQCQATPGVAACDSKLSLVWVDTNVGAAPPAVAGSDVGKGATASGNRSYRVTCANGKVLMLMNSREGDWSTPNDDPGFGKFKGQKFDVVAGAVCGTPQPGKPQPDPAKLKSSIFKAPALQAGIARAVQDKEMRPIISRAWGGPTSTDVSPTHVLEWNCEAHNCPHEMAIIVNRKTLSLILCHINPDTDVPQAWYLENENPLVARNHEALTCPSKLSEVPKGVPLP